MIVDPSEAGRVLAESEARHCESLEGTKGLIGTEIPNVAPIRALCHILETGTSTRPFKTDRGIDDAASEVIKCSRTQFASTTRVHDPHQPRSPCRIGSPASTPATTKAGGPHKARGPQTYDSPLCPMLHMG